MIAFLYNGCQGFTKKAVIKIAHDNGVGIVIVGSGNLVGSSCKSEGSFAELLLRLGQEFVIDAFLLLVVFSSVCYRIMYTCAAIRMRSVSPILGYRPQGSNRHWRF